MCIESTKIEASSICVVCSEVIGASREESDASTV